MIVAFCDEHRKRWILEPIIDVLKHDWGLLVATATYHAFKQHPISNRAARDAILKERIMTIHTHPRKRVYGIRKIHAELHRTFDLVARCTVERLCKELGVRGLVRGKYPLTTRPAPETKRPFDLAKRNFTAQAPTNYGSQTSPTCPRVPGSSTSRSSSTCSPG